MNIVFIITRSDSIGGAHIHVRDLSLALLKTGHAVTVLTGGEGPFTEELRLRHIPFRSLRYLVRPISAREDWRAIWELRWALKDLRPDLISTHSSKAGWLGRIAGRSLGISTIFTAHGWAFTDGVPALERKIYAFAEKVAAPLTSKIITVSNYDRLLALRYRVAPPDKIVAIHNGMPDVPVALRAVPELNPPRLIMVARFEPQKDHRTLLQALTLIRQEDWVLDLVGDGPLRQKAEELVRNLGLQKRVRFLGARQDVAELLAGAQVFLLISNWEGFPRSILEAMRAGLPVVASDVGGVREAVEDGTMGYLVPRGQPEILAPKIITLLEQPGLRSRLGEAGRKKYEAGFTFDHMLQKTLAEYESIVRNGRRKGS